MRTDKPRLPPLGDDELNAEQSVEMKSLRDNGPVFNITRTFLRHPRMLKAYQSIARHTFSPAHTLSRRDTEIIIMRTVWRAKSGYQWARHISIGTRAGLSEQEIAALKQAVTEGDWTDGEGALIETVDALIDDYHVPDHIWSKLSAHFSAEQCIDAVMLCGRYTMTAMFLNTAGTPLDQDVALDPDLDLRR